MTSIVHIRHAVERLPDEELREVSLAIIKRVAENLPATESSMWPVGLIAHWVNRNADDPALVKSLQLLAGWREAQLLDVHYIYFDPKGLYPEGQKISDDEVRAAYETGSLEDPNTGDLIGDFESTLEPYFVPAPGVNPG